MTECNQTFFPFEAHFSRQVVAQFEGSWLTTEGGSLLFRQVDRKIDLLRRVARCFTDYRRPERIAHRFEEMLAQRIYGLALGYEDLNDHEQLRQDSLLGVLAGTRDLSEPLAGKSTLNRLELTPAGCPLPNATTRSPTLRKRSMNCWSSSFWNRIEKRQSLSFWICRPNNVTQSHRILLIVKAGRSFCALQPSICLEQVKNRRRA